MAYWTKINGERTLVLTDYDRYQGDMEAEGRAQWTQYQAEMRDADECDSSQ